LIPPPFLKKLSLWLACASAIAILLSIAVSQILLAISVGVLLLSGLPLRWPKIALPLTAFLIWTLIALAFSPDPGYGVAQVRKMVVFTIMLVVFSSVRRIGEAKWLAMAWMLVGTATAGRGVVQFIHDVAAARAAHRDFYKFYIADRITGFQSHWMTFSGQELFILLLLIAFILYSAEARKRLWLWVPCLVITAIALILSDTRGVWIAALMGAFYLLWSWKKWTAALMPVGIVVILLVAPASVQERAKSIIDPHGQTDSNSHRKTCWRTGWEMIKAHPLLGVGPDEIRKEKVFFAYLPKDIKPPLPEGYYGHLHNFYIQYAAERGVPATLFITGALALAWMHFHRALRRLAPGRSEARFFLHAGIACIIGTLVGGIFEYNLNDTEVLTMFLTVICLGYLAVNSSATDPAI